MASINPHTTRASGTVLTATIYNNDHNNHVTNVQAVNAELGGLSGFDSSANITWTGQQTWQLANVIGTMDRTGSSGTNLTLLSFHRASSAVGQIAGANASRFEIRAESGCELRLNSGGSGTNGAVLDTSGNWTMAGDITLTAGRLTATTSGITNQQVELINGDNTASGLGNHILLARGSGAGDATRIRTRRGTSNSTGELIIDNSGGQHLTMTLSSADLTVAALRAGTNTSTGGFRCGSGTDETVVSNFGVFAREGGTINLRPNGAGNTSNQATLNTTGTLAVAGDITAGGDITASSDIRLKTDLQEISLDQALQKVLSLKPIYYTDRRGRKSLGLSAQDVLQVCPEVVHESPEGMLSLDYSKLSVLYAAAITRLAQVIHGR